MRLTTRLRKLERHSSKSGRRMFVVRGTDEQIGEIIQELKSSGKLRDGDMSVGIRVFGDPIHDKGVLVHEYPLSC
jgi:hypothetical protein